MYLYSVFLGAFGFFSGDINTKTVVDRELGGNGTRSYFLGPSWFGPVPLLDTPVDDIMPVPHYSCCFVSALGISDFHASTLLRILLALRCSARV